MCEQTNTQEWDSYDGSLRTDHCPCYNIKGINLYQCSYLYAQASIIIDVTDADNVVFALEDQIQISAALEGMIKAWLVEHILLPK